MSEKNFTPSFEEKVVQAILGDLTFAEQVIEVIESDFFDLKHTQKITDLLLDYHNKYKTFPSVSLLHSICEQDIENPIIKKECLSYIERIRKQPLNGDSEYIKNKSLMFFRTQAIKNALLNEVLPRIEKENLDEIIPVIQKAINKGSDKNIGLEYNKDEKRFIEEEYSKVPTLWSHLNKILNGGWGEKRLVTLIGNSGAGKSMVLVNIGVGALMAGKTVIHYTLELDEIETARRYDACLTGVKINDICINKNKILSILKNKIPKNSQLIIKEYPMKSASLQTVRSHLSRLRIKEVVPDLIIIDYGDLFKVIEKGDSSWGDLATVWQEMKRLAQEMRIPVVTATQSNRKGAEEEILLPIHVADSYAKIMTSDVIVTMARNIDQKAAGQGKIYLAKNRQGEDGQILSYTIDTSKCNINVFELDPDIDADLKKEIEEINKPKNISKALNDFLKKGIV